MELHADFPMEAPGQGTAGGSRKSQTKKTEGRVMKMKPKNRVSRTMAPKRGAAFAEQRLIGLIGAGPAVGVTHTAVMMAGYLTGICRRRCAVLEWNGS